MAARPYVALYHTCLVELWRPSVGLAALELLERAGCRVDVPGAQTCCGQPAWNSGDRESAAALARKAIAELEAYDYVVLPSGSCAGMLRRHYPALLAGDPEWAPRAGRLAGRCHEILGFLHDVLRARPVAKCRPARAAYHDSCSALRELGAQAQPRALLAGVEGLELLELPAAEAEVCCGFGGTFCVKYPELSGRLAGDKVRAAAATGADTLLGADLGCLLNLAGRAARLGLPLRCYHAVEALSGAMDTTPAIGEPD